MALLVGLRLLTGLFTGKRRTFTLTFQRQVALLFWPLLCLSIGLPFLASFLFAGSISTFELALLLAFSALVLGFAAPALLLHLQYYVHNQATAVVFEPKQNVLEVYQDGRRIPFGRADLARVQFVRCKSRRLFWSNYEYLQLQLHDGQTLTLTSLLLKLGPLAEFLRNANLHTSQQLFCIIRTHTPTP